MLLFPMTVLCYFVQQSCIIGGYILVWVEHWLDTGRILLFVVCTSQAEFILHLPWVYYFLWRSEFLCDASVKVDFTKSSSFSVLENPLSCFLLQRNFGNYSICKSPHTLLFSRNRGIWSFFGPSHHSKTGMMGLWSCILLHICTNV